MINWKATLTNQNLTLKDSIVLIDSASLRTLVVIDNNGVLLGVVTDGDIRRALIKNLPSSSPISEFMCISPVVFRAPYNKNEVIDVLTNMQLICVPIVDKDNKVIGLESIHTLLTNTKIDNPVLLMAGGFGKRLNNLTLDCPKPLLKVGDTPILELIIKQFIRFGFRNFYISLHYLHEMIMDYFGDGSKWDVNIKYLYENEPLGTAGCLSLLPMEEIQLPLIISNGDLLTTINYRSMLQFHNENKKLATICTSQYDHKVPYGVITHSDNLVKTLTEKPVYKYFVNTGVYVIEPEIIGTITMNEKIDMPDVLQNYIAGNNVIMFPIHEYWLDIGQIDDYTRAQTDLKGLQL